MCGIIAVATDSPAKTPAISKSLSAMARRGPDSEGEWISPSGKTKLGHRRLAIVDLSDTGRQPMHNENKTIWLVCNGEIYNYPNLRSRLEGLGHFFYSGSDNEVILHAYEEWGEECPKYLEGMFAFVIWDENQQQLFAAKDRVGIKPLCYSEIPGGLALASDLGALLPLLPAKPDPDPLAVAYILSLRYVPSPLAIWKNTHKLEPSHKLCWSSSKGLRITCYWVPPKEIDYHGDYSEEKWNELFSDVLKDHLLSDVPIGLFLSGGLDSSSIAACLSDLNYKPTALTVSFPEYARNEAPVASDTAKQLGLPHQQLEITDRDIDYLLDKVSAVYDEPHGDVGPPPMYLISQAASQHCKTVFAGDGGDECFGGYTWHRGDIQVSHSCLLPLIKTIRKHIGWTNNQIINQNLSKIYYSNNSIMQAYSWRTANKYLPEEMESLMAPCDLRFNDKLRVAPLTKHFVSELPTIRALQRVDLMTFCAELVIPKVDRASMGSSLEVRVPFLDRRIIEWALRCPVDPVEMDINNSKPILRKYLRTHKLDKVLNNPKQGFGLKIADKYDKKHAFDQIKQSWWVKSGFWHKDWGKIIFANAPDKSNRIWASLMLAKWAQKWLN